MAVSSLRRAVFAGVLGALPVVLVGMRQVWAEHGGSRGFEPLSPVVVGILADVLTLAAGVAILVIGMLRTRKHPRSGC